MSVSNGAWINRLNAVECRDSTYKPKTSPLVMAKAQGSVILDSEGKSYIDLCAGFGALPLGHNSQALQEVVSLYSGQTMAPIEHAMGDVYPSEDKILFLESIAGALPPRYSKGAVALSGGQSVEIALKTAMLHTKKSGFIVFDDAYHGLDLGVLPLTAREDFRAPFTKWTRETNVIRLAYGATRSELEAAAQKLGPHGLAAIVVEPVQGRAGVRPAATGWLSILKDICRKYDGLLILDEVFTGFGRIGKITSAEECDADVLCFGKAIGGGFPISACFAKEAVMASWPESTGEALHTGTFFGHPFSAAVGHRTLQIIKRDSLVSRSESVGKWAQDHLKEVLSGNSRVLEIRGSGLMLGVEFKAVGFAAKLMDDLRVMGVIALPSGATGATLSITPALNIPKELLVKAIGLIGLAAAR